METFPANCLQKFSTEDQPVFSSLIVNIRDGDTNDAESMLRYFKLHLWKISIDLIIF